MLGTYYLVLFLWTLPIFVPFIWLSYIAGLGSKFRLFDLALLLLLEGLACGIAKAVVPLGLAPSLQGSPYSNVSWPSCLVMFMFMLPLHLPILWASYMKGRNRRISFLDVLCLIVGEVIAGAIATVAPAFLLWPSQYIPPVPVQTGGETPVIIIAARDEWPSLAEGKAALQELTGLDNPFQLPG